MFTIRRSAAIMALAMPLIVGIAGPATALALPTLALPQLSLPTPDVPGTLTVTKDAESGTTQAEFTARRVTATSSGVVDVTTAAGLKGADDLVVAQNTSGLVFADGGITAHTNAAGTATFTGLAQGVYYVTESDAAKPTSVPFLVMIPMLSDDGTTWEYTVQADPKTEDPAAVPTATPTPTPTPSATPSHGPAHHHATKHNHSNGNTGGHGNGGNGGSSSTPGVDEAHHAAMTITGTRITLLAAGVALLTLGGVLVARRNSNDEGDAR
ncbi:MAG: hypothetical protein LBH13_00005 [Cellulomonadaceae bacterium]|jgi:hypothetical protein|nr:hypothetical protein [Cellulomonadaceae bacterium]